ncbi:hypothetical protein B0H17DRAFT_1337270 [Mycena rosella]|uniref:BTB domain-containing protein n=1 Tax=Mycena rosella TaxID=1033263 RepID=A0AAD7G5A2_MYCRO|nr:hypothetical protein B0H17DRAFT_1337270 [Mycena rosella]
MGPLSVNTLLIANVPLLSLTNMFSALGVTGHFFMKYQALFIILFLATGFAIIFSIEPVSRMIKKWRKGEDVEDVEAAAVRHSFKSPIIALPPPSLGNYSIQAEMAERRARLERDSRYMGYGASWPPRPKQEAHHVAGTFRTPLLLDRHAEPRNAANPTLSAEPYHPLFADPAADTVLRSSDGTLFRVPSAVLRRTASYFAATLPATADAEPAPAASLHACCGAGSRGALGRTGAVARVRDMLGGTAFAEEPLRLYALAVRTGWAEEARGAARATLGLALYDEAHREALARIPARGLMALLGLHRRRRDASTTCSAARTQRGQPCVAGVPGTIFVEMDTRPLGDTVTGFEVEEWSEARACGMLSVRGATVEANLRQDAILREIKACIEGLPDAV